MIDINKINDSVGYEDIYLKTKDIMSKNSFDPEYINGLFTLIKQEFPDAKLLPKEKETYITINVEIAGLQFYNMIQLGERKEVNLRLHIDPILMTDNLFQIVRNKSDMGFLINQIKNLDVEHPTELGKELQANVDFIKKMKEGIIKIL
ncbi:MAG: hypothetical protein WC390_06710 [Sulfurimonas sp.]|jgi:hypothetical protein